MSREYRRPPGAGANEYGSDDKGKTPGKHTLTDALVMEHRTQREAPAASGGPRRTTVGVGEEVTFTVTSPDGSADADAEPLAGTWSFSDGTSRTQSNDGQTSTLLWRAPRVAASRVEIRFVPQIGVHLLEHMQVIAPTQLLFQKISEADIGMAVAGADMSLRVTILPISVAFSQLKLFEISTGPVNRSGYFEKHPDPNHTHEVTAAPTAFDAQNRTIDHAAMRASARPFERGHFEWHIPNHYLVVGEGDKVPMKDKTIQTFDMDDDGTCTVSKGGQSVTRPALFTPRG